MTVGEGESVLFKVPSKSNMLQWMAWFTEVNKQYKLELVDY